MKKKIFILDDTCLSKFGGTSLTLNALAESLQDYEVFMIETGKLTIDDVNRSTKNDLWIIGNTLDLRSSIRPLWAIMQLRKFVKIEFDYGFCQYRCEQAFKNATGLDEWEPFGEKGSKILTNLYDLTHRFAKKIFYMSQGQMGLHNKMLDGFPVDSSKQLVLGSCFSVKHLMFMIEKYQNHSGRLKNTYAIIDGNGGWHTKAKGVKEAILYAKENRLDFKLVYEKNYDRFLNILSNFGGLIFLPQIHDTCPRVTIEAKLMGLDIITNDNCQHATEEWFSFEAENLANYLLSRPQFFTENIKGLF